MNRGSRLRPLLFALSIALLTLPATPAYGGLPLCFGRPPTMVGTPGDDVIRGTRGADVVVGLDGDDVLLGRSGNDRLCGGSGRDDTVGGSGNDRLSGGVDRDHLFGGGGDDLVLGERAPDVLFGNAGNDLLNGGAGLADVASYAFADGANVDLGRNRARRDGVDVVREVEDARGSDGNDVLVGDERSNQLGGGRGDDRLFGREQFDRLDGGFGDDLLAGGRGDDMASFAAWPRAVQVDLAAGTASGQGNDQLRGVSDSTGSRYDDRLAGNGGDNFLVGNLGYDKLFGRAGDDSLFANGGEVRGGPGDDMCDAGSQNEGCEQTIVSDPPSRVSITSPRPGQRLNNVRFDVVRGVTLGGITPPPTDVQVAIRRLTRNGCGWWSEGADRLVRGPCGDPRWNDGRFERGRWRYTLDATPPPGRYLVMARGVRGGDPQPFVDSVGLRLF